MRAFVGLALACFTAAAMRADDDVRVERVQFEKGKSAATLRGEVIGYAAVHYLLRAGAGQTMTVSLETAHGAAGFNVFAPGAQPGRDEALFIGETGGSRFTGKLPYPGDYLVQVYLMRSAARREERAPYTITIGIEGTPDHSVKAPAPGPWPLDTDASGGLPCSTGGATLDLQCPFRVKRNPHGATLWVVPPGERRDPKTLQVGDLRVLYFERVGPKEEFTSSDGAKLRWERQKDDSWIVTAGERERYWIPDAAIWGG